MKNLLAPRRTAFLQAFLETDPLLAFDYDGTLSPIVRHPHAAGMRPKTRRLLIQLARLRPVAVISGRMRSDLAVKLQGVPIRFLIGNHGAEWTRKPAAHPTPEEKRVVSWIPALENAIQDFPGVWLEKKNYSITVHFRESSHPLRAKRALEAFFPRHLPGVRVVGGHFVFNLVPRHSKDKGQAVLALMKQEKFRGALYCGDDLTDEDVFRIAGSGPARKVLGVRIKSSRKSQAEFCLRDQKQMDELLTKLVRHYEGRKSRRQAGRPG